MAATELTSFQGSEETVPEADHREDDGEMNIAHKGEKSGIAPQVVAELTECT